MPGSSRLVPRMQCVADGEEALEKALRDAFPFAEFTNDVMHAGASRRECTGATTTPHASAPSSPDCAPWHEDRRDGRLLFQRNKIALHT